jgi:acetyl-CoA acetyltransferase
MDSVAIVGIGATRPVRRSKKHIRALVVEATEAALDDAGIAPGMIDGVLSDGLIMPTTVPRDYIAAQFGIDRLFDAGMSYGGAASATAPLLAQMAIASGQAKYVLYYFGVDWGSRASGPYGFHDLYPAKTSFEKPYGFTGQATYFALWARRYMHEFGLTEHDLATIAVGQREVFSFTEVRHAFDKRRIDQLPYVVGLITFADAPGVRLITNIIDALPADLRIGQKVLPVFSSDNTGVTFVHFRPAPSEQDRV